MKQILVIFFAVSAFSAKAQVPATYADTVNYLTNQIVAKKSLFIGKPFSVLMDSLKIQPVRLNPSAPPADSLKGYSAFLDFNYSVDFKKQHYIIIEWQSPFPSWDVYAPIMRQGYAELKNLYLPIIIKDIEIKDYNEPDPEDDLEY